MMYSYSSKLLNFALTGSAGLAFLSPVYATTVLTNDGTGPAGQIPAGYGSNVTTGSPLYNVSLGAAVIGTPDITLTFVSFSTSDRKWEHYAGWNGRGNVIQFEEYTDGAGGTIPLNFTPNAGWAVRINSVDFDEWAGGGAGVVNWTITGTTSGTLASGTWNGSNAGIRSNVAFNVTGAIGETLTLSVDRMAGKGSYFAIDNLSFDQVAAPVPEPSAALLAASGLGALALRRRRK